MHHWHVTKFEGQSYNREPSAVMLGEDRNDYELVRAHDQSHMSQDGPNIS